MNCDEIKIKMHDFIDNLLPPNEAADFEASIVKCPKEFNKFEKLNKLTTKVRTLPLSYEPNKKILANITDKLMSVKMEKSSYKLEKNEKKTTDKGEVPKFEPEKVVLERDIRRAARIKNSMLSFVIILILGFAGYLIYNNFIIQKKPWVIEANEGKYTINLKKPSINQINDGDILKVNAGSNLRLVVPNRGFFDLKEITTLKLINSEKNNSQVEIQNPDLRFVTTGSEFNIKINIGDFSIINKKSGFYIHPISLDTLSLEVFQGFVETVSKIRNVKVVKGYSCELVNGEISLPVHQSTTEQIKKYADVLSKSPNNVNILFSLLIISQKKDVFTLFELFKRATPPNREMILDKIQNNFTIPAEITKTDLLLHKADAIEKYWQSIYDSYINKN